MEVTIRPEPTAAERQAIEQALAEMIPSDRGRTASGWYEEGMRANTASEATPPTQVPLRDGSPA
jgi:hypothetical protein